MSETQSQIYLNFISGEKGNLVTIIHLKQHFYMYVQICSWTHFFSLLIDDFCILRKSLFSKETVLFANPLKTFKILQISMWFFFLELKIGTSSIWNLLWILYKIFFNNCEIWKLSLLASVEKNTICLLISLKKGKGKKGKAWHSILMPTFTFNYLLSKYTHRRLHE